MQEKYYPLWLQGNFNFSRTKGFPRILSPRDFHFQSEWWSPLTCRVVLTFDSKWNHMFYLSNEFRLKRYFHMILFVSQLFTKWNSHVDITQLCGSVMVYTKASVGFSISTKSWQLFPFKFTEWTQSKILNYNYRIYFYIYIPWSFVFHLRSFSHP